MPSVPTYGLPKVAEAPEPNLRVSPSAPSAAFGVPSVVDPSGAASVVSKIATEARQHAEDLMADDGELAIASAQTDAMTRATSARGIDALHAAREAQDGYRQQVDSILSTIPNDRVRERVARRAQNYFTHLYEATESHAHAEQRKADDATFTALLTRGINQVTQNPDTAPQVAETAAARVEDYGRRNGWTPELIAERAAQEVSDVHYAALAQLATAGQLGKAAAYFEQAKGSLVGDQLLKAEKLVSAAKSQITALSAVDAILAAHPTAADALAAAEKADPLVRDDVVKGVMAHFTETERAQKIDRGNAKERLLKDLEAKNGRLNKASPDWLLLQGTEEGEQILHRQEQILRPPKDPGDPEAFMSALNMAALTPQTRTAFLGMNFAGKDGEGMNTAQRTQLIRLQNQYRTGDVRKDATEIHRADAEDERLMKEDLKRTDTLTGEEQQAEVQRIRRFYQARKMERHGSAPTAVMSPSSDGSTGNVDMRVPSGPPATQPLAGLLTEAPQIEASPAMIAGAAKNPAYAAYLRSVGVKLPSVLPKPEAKKE